MNNSTKKLLESYKKMCKIIAENQYEVVKCKKTRTVKWNGNVYVVSKGDFCYNCDDSMLARILYMNEMIDVAYKKNIVDLEQVKNIIEEETK